MGDYNFKLRRGQDSNTGKQLLVTDTLCIICILSDGDGPS